MIEAGMIDEYMIHEAYKAGNDRKGKTSKNICGFYTVYPYCLGYLVGSGALNGISEMLEHIDIQEMPKIYGYLKEMYFAEESEV